MQKTETADSHNDYIPAPPASRGKTILLSFLVLFAGIKFTGWIETSGAESFRAVLHAHSTTLTADRNTRILKLLVEEGARAEFETPIVVLADEGLAAKRQAQRDEVESRRIDFSKAKARTEIDLVWRMKQLDAEILELQLRSAEFLKYKFDEDIEKTAWSEVVPKTKHVVSPTEPDAVFRTVEYETATLGRLQIEALLRRSVALNASEVAAVQIQLCEDRLQELAKLKADLPEKIRLSAGVVEAERRYKQAVDELTEIENQQREITLTASAYGTVGVFRKTIGEAVSAGEPIVEILDHDRKFLVMQFPSEKLSKIAEGDEVSLRFSGGKQRIGIIQSMPPQTEKTSAGNHDDRIAVRIEEFGKLWPNVPIGSTVKVLLNE
ncbi:MAG: HlyD family efflux transporter periplasmic adaptor subunit [Planctomycetes bacterium]|nr:HlyD family efflux transporter periplasmic adaptor subunit [Planctomycetota bacterium]